MEPDLDSILRNIPRQGRTIVAIDGQSGSGKTEFAALLAPALDAQLVRLDDMYPGWDGLEAASGMVRSDIILRHRWRRWDWDAGAAADWHHLDPDADLVIEGVGALSRASRPLVSFGIWFELDERARRARTRQRDGGAWDAGAWGGMWERWAAQERVFIAREDPAALADLVIRPS